LKAIKIKITSFISDDQPGFVECKFNDAWNKEHTVQDKVPIVTEKDLDANSEYPQDGVIACEIIKQWVDKDERKIFTVTTENPWAVDTIDGFTEIDILEQQLTDINL
jgi:hypothetical protein